MSDNKPIKKINKRSFTFFGGIAFCLLAVILILNGKYFARALAYPFAWLFGMGSYVIYILIYAYGLSLFFREKGFKIRPNNFFFGGLIIFISLLIISTLIIRNVNHLTMLTMSNFMEEYTNVINMIESPTPSKMAYWNANFVNLFYGNPFGGGFCGYFLVGALDTLFKGTTGAWVIGVLIFLLGAFVIFFPYIKKIITKGKEAEKKPQKEQKKAVSQESRIDNYDVISNASKLDDIDEQPAQIFTQPAQPMNKPANFEERREVPTFQAYNEPVNNSFAGTSNFAPARFAKYMPKAQPQEVAVEPGPMTNSSSAFDTNREIVRNEQQLELNFEEKRHADPELVKAQPEFVEPVSVKPAQPRPQPMAAPVTPIETPAPAQIKKPVKWIPPSTELLENLEDSSVKELNERIAEERMLKINEIFSNFGVEVSCNSYIIGPSVTRYSIEYSKNVSVKRVGQMVDDLSRGLGGVAARFEAIVEGETYSGLEVPNGKITPVSFKEVFESLPDAKKKPLAVAFGKGIDGKVKSADFADFPHVLVAGTTGSGKSVFTHSIICTLIMRNSPDDLRLVLIDPKKVEMSKYRNTPHLLCPVINDANTAKLTLSKLVDEMNRRYEVLDQNGCSDLKQYRELREEKPELERIPYIIIFFDEYADIVDVCKDIGQPVVSIAQKARACGIHMLIATQRPSTNVITGVIKGNLPTRVALAVASYTDSMTIVDEGGAEKLLGKGDMLVKSPLVSRVGMVRLQSCFIQNKEILRIIGYLKDHYEVNYNPDFCNLVDASAQAAKEVIGSPEFQEAAGNSEEDKYQSVKDYVMSNEYMSMSRIQRECAVGFNRAGRFFKRLQDEGIVATEVEGNKGCPVLVHDKFYEGSAATDVAVSSDQSEVH